MLQHSDIADVAVIGIYSADEATELPRFVSVPTKLSHFKPIGICRAYVVHANPASLKDDADKADFGRSIQEWIEPRVARHKYLRGGECSSCFKYLH